jgi:hypothetical protein
MGLPTLCWQPMFLFLQVFGMMDYSKHNEAIFLDPDPKGLLDSIFFE